MDNIRAYIEKTVRLLAQSSNYITYFRRYNIFAVLTCLVQQSKEMLREEAHLLQRHDRNLFGKRFSEHLVASAKPKKQKQAIEVFAEKEKKKQNHFWNTPFQRHRGGVFKGRNSYSAKDMRKRGKKYSTETTAQQLEEAWIPR